MIDYNGNSVHLVVFLCLEVWELRFFYHIYPTPPLVQDMTQGQFFKRNLTGLNSEFSFSKTSCLTKAEEPSLSYYLPIAGGRIIGFIPFPRVLVLCEKNQSRIWTRVAVSNSDDDNHYTTGTSNIAFFFTFKFPGYVLVVSFKYGSIEYEKLLNRSLWPIDQTLTDTTTPDQSKHASNNNEGVLYYLVSYPGFLFWGSFHLTALGAENITYELLYVPGKLYDTRVSIPTWRLMWV